MDIDLTNPLQNDHWMVKDCVLWLKATNTWKGLTFLDLTRFKNEISLVSRGVSGGYPWEVSKNSLAMNCAHYRSAKEIPLKSIPQGDAARTLMFWCKRNATGQTFVPFTMGKLYFGEYNYNSRYTALANDTYWYIDTENGPVAYAARTADTNRHMIAMTYSGGGFNNAKIYIDGVNATTAVTSNASITTEGGTISIGYLPDYSTGYNFFNGILDDIRLYTKALSAVEIKYIYDDSASQRYEAINRANVWRPEWYQAESPSAIVRLVNRSAIYGNGMGI